MKYYNYLLFRLHSALNEPGKKYDLRSINFLLTNTSTFILWMFGYTILLCINCFFNNLINFLMPTNWHILIYYIILALLNYYLFIKAKKFLKYNFKRDIKGGVLATIAVIIIFLSFILMTLINRDLRL
jgi:O-antigen/teichoic acid export membrane protein